LQFVHTTIQYLTGMGVKKKCKTNAGFFILLLAISLAAACSRKSEPATETEAPPSAGDPYCGRPVEDFAMATRMILERADNFPKPGEKAFPFALPNAATGNDKTLSELHRDRPLVLIFGSGSCSTLGKNAAWMIDFHKRFGTQFQFAFVYIRESHPEQGYRPDKYATQIPPLHDAEDLVGRIEAAKSYAAARDLPFPILVDQIHDETARNYSAWPVRLFVIDTDGTVLYAGGQAPWFFKPFRNYKHKAPVDPKLQSLPNTPMSLEEFLERYIRKQ